MASDDDKQKGPAPDEIPDLYPRIRGKIDNGRFSALVVTPEDCRALGRMYNTDGIPGYAASVLRVDRNSALFAVMIMLMDDPGFCAALGVEADSAQLLDLPTFVESDVVYARDVPADIVWAAVAFIQNKWGKEYGIAIKFDPAAMNDYEFEHFVARLQFTPEDEAAVLLARKVDPTGVNTVLTALVRQSALLASFVNKRANPPEPELPSVPEEPPGEAGESSTTPEPEPEQEQEQPCAKRESRQLSNAEIAEEVCALVMARVPQSSFEPHHAKRFCETVRSTLKALEREAGGTHVAEMDVYAQSIMLESNSALAVAFAYTLMSAENNPFLDNLINAYLMVTPPQEKVKEVEQEREGVASG